MTNQATGKIDTSAALRAVQGAVDEHARKLDTMQWIMFAVVIVLFVGFMTLLVGYIALIHNDYKDRSSTYEEILRQLENIKTPTGPVIQPVR